MTAESTGQRSSSSGSAGRSPCGLVVVMTAGERSFRGGAIGASAPTAAGCGIGGGSADLRARYGDAGRAAHLIPHGRLPAPALFPCPSDARPTLSACCSPFLVAVTLGEGSVVRARRPRRIPTIVIDARRARASACSSSLSANRWKRLLFRSAYSTRSKSRCRPSRGLGARSADRRNRFSASLSRSNGSAGRSVSNSSRCDR